MILNLSRVWTVEREGKKYFTFLRKFKSTSSEISNFFSISFHHYYCSGALLPPPFFGPHEPTKKKKRARFTLHLISFTRTRAHFFTCFTRSIAAAQVEESNNKCDAAHTRVCPKINSVFVLFFFFAPCYFLVLLSFLLY